MTCLESITDDKKPIGSGLAITSFVLGVVGCLSFLVILTAIIIRMGSESADVGNEFILGIIVTLSIPVGIVGTILGMISLKTRSHKKFAVMGLIFSAIPVVITIFLMILGS